MCTLTSVIIIVIIIITVVHCDPEFSVTINSTNGADASLGGSRVALNKFAQYALAATCKIALLTL